MGSKNSLSTFRIHWVFQSYKIPWDFQVIQVFQTCKHPVIKQGQLSFLSKNSSLLSMDPAILQSPNIVRCLMPPCHPHFCHYHPIFQFLPPLSECRRGAVRPLQSTRSAALTTPLTRNCTESPIPTASQQEDSTCCHMNSISQHHWTRFTDSCSRGTRGRNAGAVLSKTLHGHSYLNCHPSAKFCPKLSSFQSDYNIYMKPVGFPLTNIIVRNV